MFISYCLLYLELSTNGVLNSSVECGIFSQMFALFQAQPKKFDWSFWVLFFFLRVEWIYDFSWVYSQLQQSWYFPLNGCISIDVVGGLFPIGRNSSSWLLASARQYLPTPTEVQLLEFNSSCMHDWELSFPLLDYQRKMKLCWELLEEKTGCKTANDWILVSKITRGF